MVSGDSIIRSEQIHYFHPHYATDLIIASMQNLGLDIGLGAANVLLELQEISRQLHIVLEVVLCVQIVC